MIRFLIATWIFLFSLCFIYNKPILFLTFFVSNMFGLGFLFVYKGILMFWETWDEIHSYDDDSFFFADFKDDEQG